MLEYRRWRERCALFLRVYEGDNFSARRAADQKILALNSGSSLRYPPGCYSSRYTLSRRTDRRTDPIWNVTDRKPAASTGSIASMFARDFSVPVLLVRSCACPACTVLLHHSTRLYVMSSRQFAQRGWASHPVTDLPLCPLVPRN